MFWHYLKNDYICIGILQRKSKVENDFKKSNLYTIS